MFGWTGKLLRVDLTAQRFTEESISKEVLSQFLGGKGLGTYFLYRETPPRADPLGPKNRFYLAAGPAQGTRVPITGRCAAVSKSPLTGLYIDSSIGGYLGPELKRAGYDLIIVEGQAEHPVWVQIHPEGHSINDASHLWGTTTHETESVLRKQDPKIQVVSTGPAGEHLVRFACLTHNYFRNFGRGGLGAVFGAKNLKAIAVRGEKQRIPVPDTDEERTLLIRLSQRARKAKQKGHSLHYHGTPWLVDYSNSIGMFPTKNFQCTHFDGYRKITDEAIESSYGGKKRRTPCEGCVISCAWTLKEPIFPGMTTSSIEKVGIPEYETLGLMGGNLGVSEIEAIVQYNYECNRLGLDTISTGNTIGFLMELTQKNLLPERFEAARINFGDTDAVLTMIQQIAQREGIGDHLAQGVRTFAQQLGETAEAIAVHAKGLEFPAWDPRGKLGLGLSYATAAAGASHLRGWPSTTKPPETSAITVLKSLIEQQNLKILKDSLIICHFTHSISPRLAIKDCATILKTVTGTRATLTSVTQAATRIWLLARMFNIREYDFPPRQYDSLPPRFLNEPVPEGPTKGFTAFTTAEDFDQSLTELYFRRGCDAEGHPTKTALQESGLAEIIEAKAV
ncbi:MAG: aldehyde ferredoxin oxidoreductase family protein [Promethearchaeota archaeon]